MEKIAAGVAHTVDGHRAKPPIIVPRPVPGLCSGRVLVMEYVQVPPFLCGFVYFVLFFHDAGVCWCRSTVVLCFFCFFAQHKHMRVFGGLGHVGS